MRPHLNRSFGFVVLIIVVTAHSGQCADCGSYGAQTCDMLRNVFTTVFATAFATPPDGFKVTQISYWCSYISMARDCLLFLDSCIPESVPDIHEFFYGTSSLLTICNATPETLLQKALAVTECGNKAGAPSEFAGCTRTFRGAVAQFSRQLNGGTVFRTGVNLTQLCCGFQTYDQCFPDPAVLNLCGETATNLMRSAGDALMAAYGCPDRKC